MCLTGVNIKCARRGESDIGEGRIKKISIHRCIFSSRGLIGVVSTD